MLHLTSLKKKRIFFLTIFVLFSGLVLAIPLVVEFSVRHKIYHNIENIKPKDFAIVLGAGIKNGKPGFYLKRRLDDTYALFQSGKVKKILISGDNSLKKHDEISIMNNYLVKSGIPQDKIFGDYAGFDTYSSFDRAKIIFNIQNAVVVSQNFHLKRSIYIANSKGINAVGYSSETSIGKRKYFIREYFATIKSYLDCLVDRKSKFYGTKVDITGKSNIKIKQL